ncbi:MAG: hypothetical protein E7277_05010 [Lachnospiraceae bacterium]|nr:hypothetical protein [Lachnospiraceae bacterium]
MRHKANYGKIMLLLAKNNRITTIVAAMTMLVGFTFLLTYVSFSEDILRARQKIAEDTYGTFLIVASDVTTKEIGEIKEKYPEYRYDGFDIAGNVICRGKEITVGRMKGSLGKKLGFHLLRGCWPREKREVAVEEYVLSIYGKSEMDVPCTISVIREGRQEQLLVTGVLNNYSSNLSVSDSLTIDTKVFPSIIGGKGMRGGNHSLVVCQRKLNYKKMQDDIFALDDALQEIKKDYDNISANALLDVKAYRDNEDINRLKVAYGCIINFVLLFEEVVIISFFLKKNRKVFSVFFRLGFTKRQIMTTIATSIGVLNSAMLMSGGVIALCLKSTLSKVIKYAALEEAVILTIVGCSILIIEKKKLFARFIQNKKVRLFPRIDVGMIFVQAVCMFFVMATLNFHTMFRMNSEERCCDLISRANETMSIFGDYYMDESSGGYFSLDESMALMKAIRGCQVTMEAGTNCSTILLDPNCQDSYLISRLAKHMVEPLAGNKDNKEMLPTEALEYMPYPTNDVKIEIEQGGEMEGEKSCTLVLPGYDTEEPDAVLHEGQSIYLGRVEKSKNGIIRFIKDSFIIRRIISEPRRGESGICIIINEETARKSQIVLGVKEIFVRMKENCSLIEKKVIEKEMALLHASVQGGLLDSDLQNIENRKALENYSVQIADTILFFALLAIGILIVFKNLAEREIYDLEYSILRSMGLSYVKLQKKLFIRYLVSMWVAAGVAIFVGYQAFPGGKLTNIQIVIAIASVAVVTYGCKVILCLKHYTPYPMRKK